MYKSLISVITLWILLSGCSDEKQPTPVISKDNVFKGQVDSLDKARGVEATIQADFDRQRQQIDTK